MKTSLLIAGTLLVFFAHAQSSGTVTHAGWVFEKVADDSFGLAWKAPDGSVWSQYQGSFFNQGQLGNEINKKGDQVILHSQATNACNQIGGELPSLEQFQKLTSYFTDTGDFQMIFPFPNSQNLFWTIDGRPGFARFAKLSPILDPFGDFISVEKSLSLMCTHARAGLP